MASRTVSKAELVEVIARKANLTKVAAKNALEVLLETITGTLKQGNKVQITGFGTFEIRRRKERMGRNPQTGEEVSIPAKDVPVFKAGKALKDAVG